MLLFVIVPIVEIVVIIQVGQVIGAWWTVLLLVADSLLGAWLLRREGARTWRAFREALEVGRWPGDEVAQGAMVIVGGTLLLTPGFVTDVVGFVLLVPISRRLLSRTVRSRVRARVVGGPGPMAGGPKRRKRSTRGTPGNVDVEVVEIRREERPRPSDEVIEVEGEVRGRGGDDPHDDEVDAQTAAEVDDVEVDGDDPEGDTDDADGADGGRGADDPDRDGSAGPR